jgi:hypothetical protein
MMPASIRPIPRVKQRKDDDLAVVVPLRKELQ